MTHTMNRWMAAIALISCFSCTKTEIDYEKAVNSNEKGVFGYLTPFVEEEVNTRANVLPDSQWQYVWEKGDLINIWSNTGTTTFYAVEDVTDQGRAVFSGGGFTLSNGETYYSFHPMILSMQYRKLPVTFEGQTQNGNDNAKHLPDYTYSYSSAVCTDGNTSFQYHNLVDYFRIVVTLPKSGLTINKLTITADKDVFVLNGTTDVTAAANEGTITSTEMSNTLTLTLNNVSLTDNVLKAFMASAPMAEPATYVVSVEDSNGKVYTSPEVSKRAYTVGEIVVFRVSVESEDREYVKVTSLDSDAAGKYILVYPNGTTYRAFSFTKAMKNAEKAGELAKDTHGLENILAMGSQLYATVVANNCIDVEGPANAESLILTPDQEKEAAFEVSLQDEYHRWGTVDGKVTFSTTTEKGNTYSIGVDHAVVNVNGNADVVAAFNAPDVINAVKAIRGTDLPVDFDYLINVAVAQAMKEGITFTPAQISRLKSGFEHLCVLAKSMVASHPEIFQGGTLMDINLSTNVFDVIGRYYDNATQLSWAIAPQKRFGLATLGYHAYDQGFTFNVGLPQAGWFNRLEASLQYDADHNGVLEVEDCVAYWKQFDSQYNILGIQNFFERASRRALSELDSTTLAMLQQMAATGKFAAIGNVYKQYADRFNDELEPVYIYKKVE